MKQASAASPSFYRRILVIRIEFILLWLMDIICLRLLFVGKIISYTSRKLWEQLFIFKSNLLLKVFKYQGDYFQLANIGFLCKLAAKISRVSIHPVGSNILTMHLMYEPAHDTTYNKTCVTQQGSACTSTQYGKRSLLSLFG